MYESAGTREQDGGTGHEGETGHGQRGGRTPARHSGQGHSGQDRNWVEDGKIGRRLGRAPRAGHGDRAGRGAARHDGGNRGRMVDGVERRHPVEGDDLHIDELGAGDGDRFAHRAGGRGETCNGRGRRGDSDLARGAYGRVEANSRRL